MTDTQQTDTPINRPTFQPVSNLELAKAFVGDLARPVVLILGGLGATIATVIVAGKVASGDAAAFIFAVGAGLAALYGAKAFETANIAKHQAQADVAKAQAGSGQ